MMRKICLPALYAIALLLACSCASQKQVSGSQTSTVKKDTSFTINSTYTKERKKYPFIKIANPELKEGVRIKENLVYSFVGERKLYADVFYPSNIASNKYPAVLLVFGGGWKSGDKSQMAAIGKELANNGYVAVAAEYRLSPEAQYPAALHDLKAAVRWMRKNASKYNMDKEKIAVLGVSAGGQLAALLGATNGKPEFEGNGGNEKQSSLVQAVVNIDGVLAFKHPLSTEGKVAAGWLGGTYEEKPQVWEEASALIHAGSHVPPMLFIASQYPRFHAGRDDLIVKIKPFGTYTEVHTLPDTPHPFWFFHPWFEPTIKFTVEFLDRVF